MCLYICCKFCRLGCQLENSIEEVRWPPTRRQRRLCWSDFGNTKQGPFSSWSAILGRFAQM